jgi:hypothetical protein
MAEVGVSDSFGRRLRLERERRKIPLVSITKNTKISVPLLEGLERDDLSRWPSGIFRRSFFRAYAEALGLDAEPLLREFLTRFPDSHGSPDQARADTAARVEPSALRLTLAESRSPFADGRRLLSAHRRWVAAACDCAILAGVGAGVFAAFGTFWQPFAIASLLYYVGGVLVLGNTPGVCLFGPVRIQNHAPETAPPSERPNDQDPLTNRPDSLRLVQRA